MLINRNSDQKIEVFNSMHNGEGDIEIKHIVDKADLTGKSRLIAKVTFSPESYIGKHKHENEEEIFYILSGRGLINIDGAEYEIGEGESVITKSGSTHSLRNIGNGELVVMVVILLY